MRPYGPQAEPMRPPRRTPPRDISLTGDFETYAPSFDELFDRFWTNYSDVTRPKAEEIESLSVDVPLSVDQARSGGRVRIMIPARATCPTCRGRGGIGTYECWRCTGHGAVTADYPLEVPYPAGIFNEYVVQLPLEDFGIDNFYLTIRFRVTASAW
jgi:DnaJ-class molecular chaperone